MFSCSPHFHFSFLGLALIGQFGMVILGLVMVFDTYVQTKKINDGTLTAFLFGALFGFMAYMTYDLVNYSTLAGWPLSVVIVDVLWGMTITAIASVVGMLIG
jgi:uncharacterized membrane protein